MEASKVERIDVKEIEIQCESEMQSLLDALDIEFAYDNGWYMIDCPFHSASGGKNLRYRNLSWFCFSECRKSFSTIDVVMELMDLDFRDAVAFICKAIGYDMEKVAITKSKLEAKSRIKKLSSMRIVHKNIEYKQVDQFVLNDIDDWIPPYLLEEYKVDTLKRFKIGFMKFGVLKSRVIFPIDAPDGKIISLSGRFLGEYSVDIPKYRIVEGTKKSHTLYNISRIDPDDEYVIVVEGFKGVMSLYEQGFKSVVATMGSSLSAEQKMLLLGLGRKIVVVGDNDSAGKQLAQSVYNQCYLFANVKQVDLGDFTDKEKASPTRGDIGYDSMDKLVKCLKENIYV